MVRPLALLALLLPLAGCASPASEPPPVATSAPEEPDLPLPPDVVLRAIPLALEGRIPSTVRACPYGCTSVERGERVVQMNVTGQRGTLTGLQATVTWTPSSPATQELVLAALVLWPHCNECSWLQLGRVQSGSPATLDLRGLDVVLEPGAIVETFVVPPPALADATVEQRFRLAGVVHVESAPGGA